MNDSQRAILAAVLVLSVYGKACEKNSRAGKPIENGEKGSANNRAAKAVGVKENRVRQALKIVRIKFLVDAVWRGEISISKAATIAKLPNEERSEALSRHMEETNPSIGTAEAVGDPAQNVIPKIPKSAKNEGVLKDALKSDVPGTLVQVFKARRAFARQVRTLKRIASWLEEARVSEAGRSIPKCAIDEFAKAIEQGTPYAVCPDWELHKPDEKCMACKNHGWMSRLEFEHWRETNKQKLR